MDNKEVFGSSRMPFFNVLYDKKEKHDLSIQTLFLSEEALNFNLMLYWGVQQKYITIIYFAVQ